MIELGILTIKLVQEVAQRIREAETHIRTIEDAGGMVTLEQVRELVDRVEAKDDRIQQLADEVGR
jgi:predicted trehalose synthase